MYVYALNASYPEDVFVYLNRRSYVGVELVQWLCEQCVYVRCRTTAVRVWQVLLELGVLLSGKSTPTYTHCASELIIILTATIHTVIPILQIVIEILSCKDIDGTFRRLTVHEVKLI